MWECSICFFESCWSDWMTALYPSLCKRALGRNRRFPSIEKYWPWLVGGLEPFFHVLGIMVPTDFHIFPTGWKHQSAKLSGTDHLRLWIRRWRGPKQPSAVTGLTANHRIATGNARPATRSRYVWVCSLTSDDLKLRFHGGETHWKHTQTDLRLLYLAVAFFRVKFFVSKVAVEDPKWRFQWEKVSARCGFSYRLGEVGIWKSHSLSSFFIIQSGHKLEGPIRPSPSFAILIIVRRQKSHHRWSSRGLRMSEPFVQSGHGTCLPSGYTKVYIRMSNGNSKSKIAI